MDIPVKARHRCHGNGGGCHGPSAKINITHALSLFFRGFGSTCSLKHCCSCMRAHSALFGMHSALMPDSSSFQVCSSVYTISEHVISSPPSSAPTLRPFVSLMVFEQAWALRPYVQSVALSPFPKSPTPASSSPISTLKTRPILRQRAALGNNRDEHLATLCTLQLGGITAGLTLFSPGWSWTGQQMAAES